MLVGIREVTDQLVCYNQNNHSHRDYSFCTDRKPPTHQAYYTSFWEWESVAALVLTLIVVSGNIRCMRIFHVVPLGGDLK